MKKTSPSQLLVRVLTIVTSLLVILNPTTVFAITQNDLNSIITNTPFYDPNESCGGNDTVLVGSDNIQEAFNYFMGSDKNLPLTITAAVVGNLFEESHLDPLIVEHNASHPELPSETTDPASLPVVDGWYGGQVRQPGWGLAQWTPSVKVYSTETANNVTGQVYDYAVQLNIIWAQMNGISPVGAKDMLAGLVKQPDLKSAVTYFQKNFEGGISSDARVKAANYVLGQFNSSTSPTTASVSGGCGGVVGGLPGKCDSAAPTTGYEAVKAALLLKFKVALYGDANNTWAVETYNTMCALAKSPAYFTKLTQQGTVNVALHDGACGSGHTGNNSRDGYHDPYGVALFGFCNPLYNRFLLTHELGHLYSFRNPAAYQSFLDTVWSTGASLPTYNCQHDYDINGEKGPYPAECWADMIGEYLVYFSLRDTVGGRPPGPSDFKAYPTQYAGYYDFARDKLFGGVEYTSF